jgi:hypothetical protein
MEKPIIFSTPMVRAILDGTKTMTRRIFRCPWHPLLGPVPCDVSPTEGMVEIEFTNDLIALNGKLIQRMKGDRSWVICPYGVPGDRLWVRETWQKIEGNRFIYKADPLIWGGKWKPSIFMPRAASRITLEITRIRFEKLMDISEKDAKSEGVELLPSGYWKSYNTKPGDSLVNELSNPVSSFESLWRSINGNESWVNNPWVWVIEFERIKIL